MTRLRMKEKCLLLTGILAFISSSAFAQITTLALDSIEVTASKIPTSIKKSGKSVSVISKAEIETMPVSSVDELLQSLQGVNLNSRNAFGVQADIGMRGSTFSQVLVLLDNVRINDPLTAHFNNNIPVSLSEIDRIEVIRGPAGTSYGSDAVGGIIHIKTKTYVNQNVNGNSLNTYGEIGYGQNDLWLTDMGFIAQKNKLQVSGGIKTSVSDGETLPNPNYKQTDTADSLFNNFFDLKTYTLSANYHFNEKWKLYSRIGYDNRDFSAKYFYSLSAYDESTEKIESYWAQWALNRTTGRHQTEISSGYKTTHDAFSFSPSSAVNKHTTDQFSMAINHIYAVNNSINLSFGAQGISKVINSTDRGSHDNQSFGVYGIFSAQITHHLIGTASSRIDYDENFGTQFLPQLSLAYSLENMVFRSSFGKSIRAADFTERYISSRIENLSPGRNVGNPDLKAETSYTYDAGVDFYPARGFTISNTVFYRTSDNLIDYIYTNSDNIHNVENLQPNSDYFYASNVSKSTTFGIEAQISKYFAISTHKLIHTELNYTFLHTDNEGDDVSKYIANHPRHDVNLSLAYLSEHFDFSIISHYLNRNDEAVSGINAQVKSDYGVTNLKLGLKPFDQRVSMFMKIHNVFDVDYQEILGARMPGRWLMGGLKWNIER